ncbi:MAG TPA: tRNA (uridine(54)-C5)-methyltransferase TrmA [Azospira sp.]|nr:tRNA (uridine(54)-C5)-methyltransferase TrmA [Azospira sp.]
MPLQKITPAAYPALLAEKVARFRETFAPFGVTDLTVVASEPLHFRLRAEFRIIRQDGRVEYAMFGPADPKLPVAIEAFPPAAAPIHAMMPRLRAALQASNTLKDDLFQVDFLATLSGELLITLIYHRPLRQRWQAAAEALAAELGVPLIGRSRGQKVVLGRDWLQERFELNGRQLSYQQIEGSFSQPNGGVNRQMLAWACQQAAGLGGDLLELYCGNGNFTVALAPLFERVLATEVSKASVQAAGHNLAANGIDNVKVVRLSSAEVSAALAGSETFSQLQDIDLGQYRFSTLFVDPPRAGLDEQTLELARGFQHILYISCNPQTLRDNVEALQATHEIKAAAVFDQFPYTDHLESGLLLSRR